MRTKSFSRINRYFLTTISKFAQQNEYVQVLRSSLLIITNKNVIRHLMEFTYELINRICYWNKSIYERMSQLI